MMDICLNFIYLKELYSSIKYMLISVFAFSIMNALLKHLTSYGTFQLVFFRSLTTLALTSSLLIYQKIPFFGKNKKILIKRGIFGALAMLCFFFSVGYISVGSAVSIRYISPIFAAILTVLFLKKNISVIEWVFYIISFLGIIFIKGFSNEMNLFGFLMALLAAFFSAFVYLIIELIGKKEHPLVIVNYFMMTSFLVGFLGIFFKWTPLKKVDTLPLFLMGIVGFFGQYYMTKAFQNALAYKVAPIKYVEVVLTILFGVFILNERYTLLTLLGIFMVIGGLVFNLIYKSINKN